MKIILIDNYDSFTFNLYHYLSSLRIKVDVARNDKVDAKRILKKKYSRTSASLKNSVKLHFSGHLAATKK